MGAYKITGKDFFNKFSI
jgi:hypothetical protein